MLAAEKEAVAGMAKSKVKQYQTFQAANKVGDVLSRRNIAIPPMLYIYSNIMELHRLRNEIILAASECAVLTQIFNE